jgi:hypothetical protein
MRVPVPTYEAIFLGKVALKVRHGAIEFDLGESLFAQYCELPLARAGALLQDEIVRIEIKRATLLVEGAQAE